MFYVPYVQIVGERGFKETRSLLVRNDTCLPDDNYGFMELNCSDPQCAAPAFLFRFSEKIPTTRIWATINYGFATPEYYGVWVGDPSFAMHLARPSLEPTGSQSPYAPALLELFRSLLDAAEYAARLERHYDEVKHLTCRASDKRCGGSILTLKPMTVAPKSRPGRM